MTLFNHLVKSLAGKKFTKNILVAKSFYYLKSYCKPKSITINGNVIYLDRFDSLNLSINPAYEKESMDFITKYIKETDIIVDVGANIGYYTLFFAKLAPEGMVYPFEPDTTNFELLRKNIKANKYSNIIPDNRALSDKSGVTYLMLNKLNTGGHRISSDKQKHSIGVEMIRLDDYIHKADFVKLDVEGAETMVINGMQDIIKNNNLKMLVEYNEMAMKNFGVNPTEFIRLLAKDFTIIDTSNGLVINPNSFATDSVTNLFCYKEKK